MTLSRREIAEELRRHDLHPRRALGQNFVADANTVRRIARLAALSPGDAVVEIGAGLGSLTLALAETGALVSAVEVDAHLVPLLRGNVELAGVRVVEADALELDWDDLLAPHARWALVSNLPYNVAVPVLARVLEEAPRVTRMLVMVQEEVGARLVAAPGSRAYGAISVKLAYHANASMVGRVPASVFVPRPRVESVLVRIDRRPAPALDPTIVPPGPLFELVRLGFSQRRKMLRRVLHGVVDAGDFDAAGVDPRARAEDLDVAAWGRLATASGSGAR
jgi:16S rRNA (adenine1518-N6/adenine1519-N6)-dimethyltransferase